MGEQRAVVDVAGRVQPVEAGDEHGVVGLQPGAGLESDRFQADVAGSRRTAGRDQHLLGFDGGSVDEFEDDTVAGDRVRLGVEQDRGTLRPERLGHPFTGEGLRA